jgi:hypothetical protein
MFRRIIGVVAIIGQVIQILLDVIWGASSSFCEKFFLFTRLKFAQPKLARPKFAQGLMSRG